MEKVQLHEDSVIASRHRRSEIGALLLEVIWAVMMVSLPITSFPLLSRFSGGSQVSPFLSLPAMILLVFAFFPMVNRNRSIPSLLVPLMMFVSVALAASNASLFLEIRPAHMNLLTARQLRAVATLLAGVAVYVVVATFPNSERSLRRTLIYLYIGGVLTMGWASVQAYFLLEGSEYPGWIVRLHSLLSIRDLHYQRVVGLAYEPSWLSNQLVLVYLPLWGASVFRGYSVFSIRIGPMTAEAGLALWGLAVHFFTLSRIGLVSVFFIFGYLLIGPASRLINRSVSAVQGRFKGEPLGLRKPGTRMLRLMIWLVLISLFLATVMVIVLLGTRFDPRISRLFETNYGEVISASDEPVLELAKRFEFGERLVYWTVGLRVFGMHPWLGAGLGGSGFFFDETIPSLGYRMPEIIRVVSGPPEFPNVKNLWLRLLSETGVIGFATFVVWIVLLWLAARLLARREERVLGVIGMAGVVALLAQLWEGLSLDSFAMAQLWIMPGLVTASLTAHYRKRQESQSPS